MARAGRETGDAGGGEPPVFSGSNVTEVGNSNEPYAFTDDTGIYALTNLACRNVST